MTNPTRSNLDRFYEILLVNLTNIVFDNLINFSHLKECTSDSVNCGVS